MKLREKAQMELEYHKAKLAEINARIEREIEVKRALEKEFGYTSKMNDILLANYKAKGVAEGAIRIYELMLENRFEDE